MEKIKELDGLRGLAVTAILFYHALRFSGESALAAWTNKILDSTWIGVDLFFVLSGFLITRILLQSRADSHRYKNFYIRRCLRIFPVYYLVVLTAWGITLCGFKLLAPVREIFPYHFTYTFNLWTAAHEMWPSASSFNHFWSLCIEEHFYLFWPFLVFSLPIGKLKQALFCFILLSLTLRFGCELLDFGWVTPYTFTLCRLDGLSIGGLLGIHYFQHGNLRILRLPKLRLIFFLAAICLVHLLLKDKQLQHEDTLSMVLLPTIVAIFTIPVFSVALEQDDNRWKKFLRNPALCRLGIYAYGIYIYHQLIHSVLHRMVGLPSPSPQIFVVLCITTLVVAALSYEFFEKPFLRLKDRFAPVSGKAEKETVTPSAKA
ncbi:MAG TPA: acyltransferase [Verrucomicrobiae bacterium]